jgi:hypothetical protein
MRLTLLNYDFDVTATKDEKYKMTIFASEGLYRFDEIKQWLSERTNNISQ